MCPDVEADTRPTLGETSSCLLEPLADLYRELELPPPVGRTVAPLTLPHEYQRLLVHARGMTQTLEAVYGERVALKVLRSMHRGPFVARHILLLLQDRRVPVEMALIRIYLDHLPSIARQPILDEVLPLGTILRSVGVTPSYAPSFFFALDEDQALRAHAAINGAGPVYGRRVKMSGADGQLIADAIEIGIPIQPPND